MHKRGFTNESNAHNIDALSPLLIRKSEIYREFFTLLLPDHFQNIERHLISAGTLGVHLRGTDKHTEIQPPPNEVVLNNIKRAYESYNCDNIFLATDDAKYRSLLVSYFGDTVRYVANTSVSLDGNPLHKSSKSRKQYDDALLDTYLLSKCRNLLFSQSNLSYLALTMGHATTNNYEPIYII